MKTAKAAIRTSVLILIFALSAASFFSPSLAHAALRGGVYWVPNLNKPDPDSNTGGYGFAGGGFSIEQAIGLGGGLESGFYYVTHVLNSYQSANFLVPLGLRFWLNRFITFSAGGYLNYQLTYVPTNLGPIDYGARGSAGLNYPLGDSFSLTLEVGYQFALANRANTDATRFVQNQIFAQVGVRFGNFLNTAKIPR